MEELSHLTVKEWVSLKATLHAVSDRRFSCSDCLSQYDGRGDAEKMTQALRESKGCWGGETLRHSMTDSGRKVSFTTCIGNWVSPVWYHWLGIHEQYRQGNMPFPGSVLEQPNKVLEVFDVMDRWQAERAREAAVKAEQRRAKAGRRG